MEHHSRKLSLNAAGRDDNVERVKAKFESLEGSRSAEVLPRRGSSGRGGWKDSSKHSTSQDGLGFHKQKPDLTRDPRESQETRVRASATLEVLRGQQWSPGESTPALVLLNT